MCLVMFMVVNITAVYLDVKSKFLSSQNSWGPRKTPSDGLRSSLCAASALLLCLIAPWPDVEMKLGMETNIK
jgi:hypothetical protein